MKNQLEKLSSEEKELIYRAPALVSVLAASSDGVIDKQEKADAIEMAHLRTFTAEERLQPYYMEVEKIFKPELERILATHGVNGKVNEDEVQAELDKIKPVFDKLDKEFSDALQGSLRSYAEHISKVHHNFIYNIILPVDLPGIND